MIYGYVVDLTTMIVAADSLADFENFEIVIEDSDDPCGTISRPSILALATDDEYADFRVAPLIVKHKSADQRDQFLKKFGVTIVERDEAIKRHERMMEKRIPVSMSPSLAEQNPDKTIGELYGLDKYDPWDTRTPEQKARDAQEKAIREALKKFNEENAQTGGPFVTSIRGKNVIVQWDGAETTETEEVVQEKDHQPVGPRPWNDRASEWEAMSDEERRKSVKGSEFLYAGREYGFNGGTIVMIVPKDYYEQHGMLYPQSLPIDHLLPQDHQEIVPGVYRFRNLRWVQVTNGFGDLGLEESLDLLCYFNQKYPD